MRLQDAFAMAEKRGVKFFDARVPSVIYKDLIPNRYHPDRDATLVSEDGDRYVSFSDIMSETWEVDDKVTITSKEFWEAVDASYSFSPLQGFSDSRGSWVSLDAIHKHSMERMSKLAEKLGLGPREESSK